MIDNPISIIINPLWVIIMDYLSIKISLMHPIHQPNLICRILWPHVLSLEVTIHNNSPRIFPAICYHCSISVIANKPSLTLQGPHSHYVECLPLVVGMLDRTGPILPFAAQGILDEILATLTALTTSTLLIVWAAPCICSWISVGGITQVLISYIELTSTRLGNALDVTLWSLL